MTIRLSLFARCCRLLVLISIQLADTAFPDIKIPSGKQPHFLGLKKNWGELETAIKPLEGFRVTSAAAEAHLAKTRTMFDESKGADGWGIIHNMVGNLGGDNDTLLEKLLALGLHPDLEHNDTWRPSHLCSSHARPKSAKAISLCRPNLSAKNKNNDTPLEAARTGYKESNPSNSPEAEKAKIRPAVALVWKEVENNGFPSIAEMASNKQWFAVQNLVRRGVVCRFTEGSVQHEGKTAIEWAVRHGESSLAEELRYYLERYPSDLVVALDEEAKLSATRFTTLDTKLQENLVKVQMELKLAQDTSFESQKTLRDEIIKDIRETEKRQNEVAQNITESIIIIRVGSEEEQSKLRQLLKETVERQKQLEEQVHTLKQALEDAHLETKAYLYSSYSLLEQSLDNRNNDTAGKVAGFNESNMAKPAEG